MHTLVASNNSDSIFHSFHMSRMNINKTAMLVLGSWATANIIIGGYGNLKSSGRTKYFYQFNAMWNVVNLGIASLGFLNASKSNPSQLSNLQILNDYTSLQNFLMLNAGLDLAYIMTGFYLRERAKSSPKGERLIGYGNSLLLQGGFLLIFDVALYFIHLNNAKMRLYPHLDKLFNNEIGIGLNFEF